MSGFDFLRSRPAGAPNRAEVALAEEHRLLARVATERLRLEVYSWAVDHEAEISPAALRDLFERVGLRKKP
jgi:hypothetical protein